METPIDERRPRVLVLGGGFAGLNCTISLRNSPVEVLLADRRNYHLFQPLLYQVATASLSPAEIASPIRQILRRQRNAFVILDEALAVDPDRRTVAFENKVEVQYDYLVVATGATHSYFNRPEWAKLAPGLKTIEDATQIRKQFLLAFEQAELEADPEARRRALTFIIVGGGPTGVELAGAIAEIAHNVVPRDFRRVDTTTARIILIHSQLEIVPSFPPPLRASAKRQLEHLGVEVIVNCRVTEIDDQGVLAGDRRFEANTVLWAAGVQGSPIGATLGVPLDRSGRVKVGPDLTIPGRPATFVAGDLAAVVDCEGKSVPGVAQGALQMGKYIAELIDADVRAKLAGDSPPNRSPFCYHDKGSMAVIGRNKAIAELGTWKWSGLPAWMLWAGIHLFFLISFRSRVAVFFQWVWSYLFFDRGARLITGEGDVKLTRPWEPDRLPTSS